MLPSYIWLFLMRALGDFLTSRSQTSPLSEIGRLGSRSDGRTDLLCSTEVIVEHFKRFRSAPAGWWRDVDFGAALAVAVDCMQDKEARLNEHEDLVTHAPYQNSCRHRVRQ